MASSPLIPNLEELAALLQDDGLAKAMAESIEGVESETELAQKLRDLVTEKLDQTRKDLSDA